MRLYFVYRGRTTPSGGHKQARLMVSLLNEMGKDASLLLDGATGDERLYRVEVPVAPFPFEAAGSRLGADDVLIFPEARLRDYLCAAGPWACRKAVLNQNGFFALAGRPPGRYSRHGIEFAITISPYIASVTRDYLGLEGGRIFYVPHWVVRGPFEEGFPPGAPRELSVGFMPRKLPELAERVRRIVAGHAPDVPWVEIDGVPEEEVARRFRSIPIFFSTQDREGCPLPALEAMSCGCVVAGYRGTAAFPHPYASPRNGFWAPDRSIYPAARQVLRAIEMVRGGGAPLEALRARGLETSRGYTKEAVLRALATMIEVVERRDYRRRDPGLIPLGWRGHLFARNQLLGRRVEGWRSEARDWFSGRTPARAAQ